VIMKCENLLSLVIMVLCRFFKLDKILDIFFIQKKLC